MGAFEESQGPEGLDAFEEVGAAAGMGARWAQIPKIRYFV